VGKDQHAATNHGKTEDQGHHDWPMLPAGPALELAAARRRAAAAGLIRGNSSSSGNRVSAGCRARERARNRGKSRIALGRRASLLRLSLAP